MSNTIDKTTEQYIINYVTNQELTYKSKHGIKNFCEEQPPLSITVYRGHKAESPIINPALWYSASYDINVASKEFADKSCCLFIIHLHNVPCINVNSFVGNKIGDKQEEKEIIFLGKGNHGFGKFYKNSNLTEEGITIVNQKPKNLKLNNQTVYECWYSLDTQHISKTPESKKAKTPESKKAKTHESNNNVIRALGMIDEEEYDMIHTEKDIIVNGINLTDNEKTQILNIIKKRREESNNSFGGNTKKYRSKKYKSTRKHRRLTRFTKKTRL